MAANDLDKLGLVIERHLDSDGSKDTLIPELKISRISAPSDHVPLVYEPC